MKKPIKPPRDAEPAVATEPVVPEDANLPVGEGVAWFLGPGGRFVPALIKTRGLRIVEKKLLSVDPLDARHAADVLKIALVREVIPNAPFLE